MFSRNFSVNITYLVEWRSNGNIMKSQIKSVLLQRFWLKVDIGGTSDCYIWAMSWENLLLPYANNKGTDQPVHLRSLISTFVVHCLDSTCIILPLAIAEISSLQLVSVAEQAGWSLNWWQTLKTGYSREVAHFTFGAIRLLWYFPFACVKDKMPTTGTLAADLIKCTSKIYFRTHRVWYMSHRQVLTE